MCKESAREEENCEEFMASLMSIKELWWWKWNCSEINKEGVESEVVVGDFKTQGLLSHGEYPLIFFELFKALNFEIKKF